MVTVRNISDKTDKIALLGLGYVGLSLVAAFGKVADVVGFDISEKKIDELKGGYDATGELFPDDLVGGHCIGVDPYYLTHKAEARSATSRRRSSPGARSTTAWASTWLR